MTHSTTPLAVIELQDRDGSVRHSVKVNAWPLRVGRALDNDLVLDDPYTAPCHFSVDVDETGVFIQVGNSINGLQMGAQRVLAGERQSVGNKPAALIAGRTHLCLRLPEHVLAPEQALTTVPAPRQGLAAVVLPALCVLALLGFTTYLDTDPEIFVRTLGSVALTSAGTLLTWCGLWMLLSKIFTRQTHFGWHARVALTALLSWTVLSAGIDFVAFTLSWPWLADFDFIAGYAIVGATLYFHLQAVELHRPRFMRAVAAAGVVAGVGVTLWFNWQRNERLGSELYLTKLFPPATRAAQPLDVDGFMQRLAPLQATLDRQAGKKDDANDNVTQE